jgi:glycosyltransferase involved in cell wall biosynthesis
MRILFLTQVLPYPLDAGPKVRAYYVLRHLAQAHAVTLVSFVRPTDTPDSVAHLAQFCQAVHIVPMPRSRARDAGHLLRSLVTGRPFIIARDWVPEMADSVWQIVNGMALMAGRHQPSAISHQPFDVIHADQLWMAPYALLSRNPQSFDCPFGSAQGMAQDRSAIRNLQLVLDQHNAVYMVPARLAEGERNPVRRALLALEARKMARYEVETCRKFDRVVWVTRQDHEAVQRQVSDSGLQVPNSAVIPICGDPQTTPVVTRKANARRITFVGGLHYPPNAQGVLWFAEQVWPHVQQQIPDAILTIIGKNPPGGFRISDFGLRNLEVMGYVADPRPYLEETAVFIVPLLAGGGMRVKIVDAWTWGLPVVSTTVGAEGIEIRPGENILTADTSAAFAGATVRLLQSPEEGQRLAQAGRQWVERRYDWRTVYQLWDQVYAGLGTAG